MNTTSIVGFTSAQTSIAPGAAYGLSAIAGQAGFIVKFTAIGGTMWVGGASVAPNFGYIPDVNETISVDAGGSIYLYPEGATATISVLKALTV